MAIDKMRVVELKASAKEHGIKVYSKGYLERYLYKFNFNRKLYQTV